MSIRDDINELYRRPKTLDKICIILFGVNIAISLIAAYAGGAFSCLKTTLVVIAFLYAFLSVINDDFLWFRAESARRKNSIQAAFKVRLDRYETQGYYNNNANDSELSYALNQFESVFFTKEISEKMLFGAVIKMVLAIMIVIVSCQLISNVDVLVIVAQTAFSTVVLEDFLHLFSFSLRVKNLYNNAYHNFITVGVLDTSQRVWLKYFCVEYESIKSHYRVRLSESVFNKLNLRLSEEWKTLSEQIKISLGE